MCNRHYGFVTIILNAASKANYLYTIKFLGYSHLCRLCENLIQVQFEPLVSMSCVS